MSPRRRLLPLLLLAAAVALSAAGAPHADPSGRNNSVAALLRPGERAQLLATDAFAPGVLEAISAAAAPDRLRADASALAARAGNLSIGSRPPPGSGPAPVHRALLDRLGALGPHGVSVLASFRALVPAPVPVESVAGSARRTAGSWLESGSSRWRIAPLWPNGAMPSLTPAAGLSGPLVYAGSAGWDELRGLDLRGSIAVAEFGSGWSIQRLFGLGASAVILLEDDRVSTENAERLHAATPVALPRFYVGGTDADTLRAAARDARTTPARATVNGGHIYEERLVETIVAWLPPHAPATIGASPALLADLIAADEGLAPADLERLNPGASSTLQPGSTLRLPGGRTVTLGPDEWPRRLAASLGSTPPEILAANPALAGWPQGPFEVTVPVAPEPLVLFAPIDSCSVAPDAPHGARTLTNTTVALAALEFLATTPAIHRRRGLVVVFTDGDSLGGVASRTVAESIALARRILPPAAVGPRDVSAARYGAAIALLDHPAGPAPDPASALWLAGTWLAARVEEARVRLAEERVRLLAAATTGTAGAQVRQVAADLEALVQARRASLDRRLDPPATRIEALLAALESPDCAPAAARAGLTRRQLRERLAAESAGESLPEAIREANVDAAHAVLQVLQPPSSTGTRRFSLGWYLDLADAGTTTEITSTNAEDGLRRGPVAASAAPALGRRLRRVLALAAISAGWPEAVPFVAQEDRSTFASVRRRAPAAYDEFWIGAGIATLVLGTANDRVDRVDTPHDTLDRIDFGHLSIQARHALFLVALAAGSPLDGRIDLRANLPEFARITGRAVEFNVRGGLDADAPVPGAIIAFPGEKEDPGSVFPSSSAWRGSRRLLLGTTRAGGGFRLPVEDAAFNRRPTPLFAYQLDPQTARFVRVASEGQVGNSPQRPGILLQGGRDTARTIVLANVQSVTLFPGTDPMAYHPIGGNARGRNELRVVDARTGGPPRDFAIDDPLSDYRETEVAALVLYGPPGSRLRFSSSTALEHRLILAGPLDAAGKGTGIRLPAAGEAPLTVPLTALAVAEDMLAIARHRLRTCEEHGISDRPLAAAIDRADTLAREAREASGTGDWQRASARARDAWGILVKHLPRVLQLGREAVFSAVVLMALLVPAAWFAERLLIRARGIVGRIAGTAALVAAGTLFLDRFHPAFRIALSPAILVIAFTMILLSVIVLALCYARFDVLLRRARIAGGEAESEEISLADTAATAFSLGVANLRRRLGRTLLTTATVAILAFSIVAFVSVTGGDSLDRRPVPLDVHAGLRTVDPLPPASEGILVRGFSWQEMRGETVAGLIDDLGGSLPVAVRGSYIEVEGGNQADREGVNQIPVTRDGRTAVLTAIVALGPEEPGFTGIDRAVADRLWFTPLDHDEVILPAPAAQALGISRGDIADAAGTRRPAADRPEVVFSGRAWKVAGILDPDLADRIRDINGRSLAVVDHLRSGMNRYVPGNLEDEGESFHLPFSGMIVVPFASLDAVRGRVRSVAARFPPGFDATAFFDDLVLRLNQPVFVNVGDRGPELVNARRRIRLDGLARLTVPVLLCVLIVMNTMLGTVEERRGEVAMLGAIGLSPRQIALLLLGEATVFSVLAVVAGTFGGLLFANTLGFLEARGIGLLTGLSLNFTSLLSVLLAAATALVVILATLIPARRAAALAAPSGQARWQLPEPRGDELRFLLPFTLTRSHAWGMLGFLHAWFARHADPASEDFNGRRFRVSTTAGAHGPSLSLDGIVWLAPYDLDVSQHLTLSIDAGPGGVCTVRITLRRLSGSGESWLRTSHAFLDLVRRQFLLWRNLAPDRRAPCEAAARSLAADPAVDPGDPAPSPAPGATHG